MKKIFLSLILTIITTITLNAQSSCEELCYRAIYSRAVQARINLTYCQYQCEAAKSSGELSWIDKIECLIMGNCPPEMTDYEYEWCLEACQVQYGECINSLVQDYDQCMLYCI
jgi:hypothetical protein